MQEAPLHVPTVVAAVTVHLQTWEDPALPLGPYTEVDPEIKVVRPQNMQLTPGHNAALIIHCRKLLAKDVYQELYGSMLVQDKWRPVQTSSLG